MCGALSPVIYVDGQAVFILGHEDRNANVVKKLQPFEGFGVIRVGGQIGAIVSWC